MIPRAPERRETPGLQKLPVMMLAAGWITIQ